MLHELWSKSAMTKSLSSKGEAAQNFGNFLG